MDAIKYQTGGGSVPEDEYLEAHADLVHREAWIIDGFGSVATAWKRFSAADTLIYVDLPLCIHYMWVTKRLIKGIVANPEGWPADSRMWRSTVASYRVISLCHRHLTPRYRQLVAEAASAKRVHHLRSPRQMRAFVEAIEREFAPIE